MSHHPDTSHPLPPGANKKDSDLPVALGVAAMFVLIIPVIMVAIMMTQPKPAPHPWAEVAGQLGVEPSDLVFGEVTFRNTCALCHGREANGVPRLGKPLRNSAFVQDHTDAELFNVIMLGRAPADPENTTGAAMPPRAGNPALADDRVRNVIYYLRALQDPNAPHANLEPWIVDRTASSGEGIGGVGHDAFMASCSACHGPNGEGMEGLGKALVDSPFVTAKTDAELMTFIKTGRPIWDAENTTGVDMPPKGGNPALSDEEIKVIISYIRALHDHASTQK